MAVARGHPRCGREGRADPHAGHRLRHAARRPGRASVRTSRPRPRTDRRQHTDPTYRHRHEPGASRLVAGKGSTLAGTTPCTGPTYAARCPASSRPWGVRLMQPGEGRVAPPHCARASGARERPTTCSPPGRSADSRKPSRPMTPGTSSSWRSGRSRSATSPSAISRPGSRNGSTGQAVLRRHASSPHRADWSASPSAVQHRHRRLRVSRSPRRSRV